MPVYVPPIIHSPKSNKHVDRKDETVNYLFVGYKKKLIQYVIKDWKHLCCSAPCLVHKHTQHLPSYSSSQLDVQRLLVEVRICLAQPSCASGDISALQWTNITAYAPDKMALLAHILLQITQTVNTIIMNSKNEALRRASDMWGSLCLHHQSNWWLVIKPESKKKNLFPGYWN